jgi:predicted HD superfamily hydrolase involved in NAD metabolism
MDPALVAYVGGFSLTGDFCADAAALLRSRGRADTADHSQRVAAMARRLARRWGADERSAEVAGWLHDISAIVPGDDHLQVAEMLGLEVLEEERQAPVLVHQKLSVAIARQVLAVADGPVLSAVGCHTTLKADSSLLDKVVFVADKMAWDQPGDPPYLAAMASAADQSLDRAAYCYLDYLQHKHKSMHPWASQAYRQLSARVQQAPHS